VSQGGVPKQVLITGATGFVGRQLVTSLASQAHQVVAAVRTPCDRLGQVSNVVQLQISDLATNDWRDCLARVDAVVHLAARVHVMRDQATDPLAAFRQVNVDGTRRLAEAAAEAGVQRFVFVSSIKVNGEATFGQPFTPEDPPRPLDPYAVSKHEAELALAEICASAPMTYTVVRPPLVYGPGVAGNFARLVSLVDRGVPLPLASVDNRRSMVSVANLVDLLARCAVDARAADQVFLVSDGRDWSTPALIRAIAAALGRPSRLIPFPPRLLQRLGAVAGMGALLERLCGSLQVDDSATRSRLDWHPPQQPDCAIREAVGVWQAAQRGD
jgi:nucleoside-diphosphate-sugar epimerase